MIAEGTGGRLISFRNLMREYVALCDDTSNKFADVSLHQPGFPRLLGILPSFGLLAQLLDSIDQLAQRG